MPTQRLTPSEKSQFQLLCQEIETLGVNFEHERLERRAQIDQLQMQIEVLKKLLEEKFSGFENQYQKEYAELLQTYDPEKDRKSA